MNYNYTFSINGENYNFTKDITVSELSAGNYEFCISIPGYDNFSQCYSIAIDSGIIISAKSSIQSNRASVEIIEGTAPYTIFINGKELFKTGNSLFNFNVKHGDLIEVKTANTCEGTLLKAVDLFDELLIYPNPTKGKFEILVPISLENVKIEVYTMNSQLISSENYNVENGKVQMNIENKPSAIYIVKIYLENIVALKIIKQ